MIYDIWYDTWNMISYMIYDIMWYDVIYTYMIWYDMIWYMIWYMVWCVYIYYLYIYVYETSRIPKINLVQAKDNAEIYWWKNNSGTEIIFNCKKKLGFF